MHGGGTALLSCSARARVQQSPGTWHREHHLLASPRASRGQAGGKTGSAAPVPAPWHGFTASWMLGTIFWAGAEQEARVLSTGWRYQQAQHCCWAEPGTA